MGPSPFIVHELTGHIQSIFLVEYPDRILVLDGGCRCDAVLITRFVTRTLRRSMDDVRLAVVTHMHPDHAGGIMLLRRRHHIPVASHAAADSWYAGVGGAIQHVLDIVMAWFVVIRVKSTFRRLWYRRRLAPDHPLEDGSALPGFPDWRAIAVPGHTTHDIALYHESTGVLYVADLMVQVKSTLTMPIPVSIPELMERSLVRLAALPVRTLLVAHGGRIEHPSPKIFTDLVDHIAARTGIRYALLMLLCGFPAEIRRTKRALAARRPPGERA